MLKDLSAKATVSGIVGNTLNAIVKFRKDLSKFFHKINLSLQILFCHGFHLDKKNEFVRDTANIFKSATKFLDSCVNNDIKNPAPKMRLNDFNYIVTEGFIVDLFLFVVFELNSAVILHAIDMDFLNP